jgi:hypothetical protein
MPRLDDASLVLDNYAPDLIELARTETSIPGQDDRTDPELGLIPVTTDVDMRRFGAVKAVEKQPVRSRNTGDSRHGEIRPDDLIVAAARQVRLTTRAQPRRAPDLGACDLGCSGLLDSGATSLPPVRQDLGLHDRFLRSDSYYPHYRKFVTALQ